MAEPQDSDRDNGSLLLVVVGAHLRAEIQDRPLADRLRRTIAHMLEPGDRLRPVVCSDLWYLNDRQLMVRPTIAVGSPDVNAATAYLANRIPTAFLIHDRLRIHLDVELVELRACLWGMDAASTAAAVDVFAERHLGEFLRAAREAAPAGGG